jgi:two-component system chemotaxis response regulator CheB
MGRISVLVVDDSVVIRRLVTSVLDEDPDITVVGTAASGRIALAKLLQVAPDCVTLDIEMPDLDGLGTLRELRKTHPRLPVIMFSTLTERGAATTLDALALGANDYVTKPANVGSVPAALASVREQLVPKIKALCPLLRSSAPAVPRLVPLIPAPAGGKAPSQRVDVLAIGSSTGGPDALTSLLPLLPASFPVPVVIVQHMPPVFTKMFAQRLDGKVRAAASRRPRTVTSSAPVASSIAPGDRHMELRRVGAAVQVG